MPFPSFFLIFIIVFRPEFPHKFHPSTTISITFNFFDWSIQTISDKNPHEKIKILRMCFRTCCLLKGHPWKFSIQLLRIGRTNQPQTLDLSPLVHNKWRISSWETTIRSWKGNNDQSQAETDLAAIVVLSTLLDSLGIWNVRESAAAERNNILRSCDISFWLQLRSPFYTFLSATRWYHIHRLCSCASYNTN